MSSNDIIKLLCKVITALMLYSFAKFIGSVFAGWLCGMIFIGIARAIDYWHTPEDERR